MNNISNSELVCPYCHKNNVQIIATVNLILESTPKGLKIDLPTTQDLMEDVISFEDIVGNAIFNYVKINPKALKHDPKRFEKNLVAICYTDECSHVGMELKFTELILNDDTRIENKTW